MGRARFSRRDSCLKTFVYLFLYSNLTARDCACLWQGYFAGNTQNVTHVMPKTKPARHIYLYGWCLRQDERTRLSISYNYTERQAHREPQDWVKQTCSLPRKWRASNIRYRNARCSRLAPIWGPIIHAEMAGVFMRAFVLAECAHIIDWWSWEKWLISFNYPSTGGEWGGGGYQARESLEYVI